MNRTILKLILSFGAIHFSYSQKLELPESAAFDSETNAYYISSIKSNSLFTQNIKGEQSIFTEMPSHSLGLTIFNKTIYVVTENQVVGIDIATKKQNFIITLQDAEQLNDITVDEQGILYVTDKVGNTVFKINAIEKKCTTLVKEGDIVAPNGIVYDSKSKMLLVCNSTEKSNIYTVNPNNGEAKIKFSSEFTNFDGITTDNNGNIYVTSWDINWLTSRLIKFSKTGKSSIVLANAKGMADLSYNKKSNKIVVTNTLDNSITELDPKKLK